MTFSKWIEINNKNLVKMVGNIIKNENDVMDLYQSVIEQILSKPAKADKIEDTQKVYYFIRLIKNNYYSKTSPYHYKIRKVRETYTPLDESVLESIPDTIYDETIPDIDWVKKELNTLDWFSRDLFLLYIELETITKVSKQTQIPLNSVSRYITRIKNILKEKWEYERKLDF
jgi:DNA-directed RNA polymerase specialized sigma24 family protein